MTVRAAPPVLVLAFNRPALLRSTLRNVVASRPHRVYVNIDGPRDGVTEDEDGIASCIEVVHRELNGLDVQLRTHSANQGLGHGARSAISWFFAHEQRGVVLEDDILISPGSLALAGALLDKFAGDDSVGSVSLFSAVPPRFQESPQATYRRSGMPPSWYWGSWRDRWDELITDFREWRDLYSEAYLEEVGGPRFAQILAQSSDADSGKEDVNWEGAWVGTHFAHRWHCVVTNETYCVHAGYDESATHLNEQPAWQPTKFAIWNGSMIDPDVQRVDRRADSWTFNQRFVLTRTKRAKVWLGKKLPALRRVLRRFTVQPPQGQAETPDAPGQEQV